VNKPQVVRSTSATNKNGLLMVDSNEPLVFINVDQALLYLRKNPGVKNALVCPVSDFYEEEIKPNIAVGENGEVQTQNVLDYLKSTKVQLADDILALVS
jgi:hypothetical protein